MFRRFNLFEFGDQPWLSGWMREAYQDCLYFVHHTNQPYHHFGPLIAEWAKATNTNEILDIASGSAEQIAVILQTCREQRVNAPRFILSDLYPDTRTYARLQNEFGDKAVGYIEKPVSAFNMRGINIRYWSIHTAFHHFTPENARQFLQQFSYNADGLCILEMQERSIYRVITMICAFPSYFIAPFLAKKFRFKKLLFTTIIPVIPLMMTFDGIVSALRTYTREEIMALMPPSSENIFEAQYKEVKWPSLPFKSSMLIFTRKVPS